MIAAFAISYHLGTTIFFAMAGLSILGIIYSIPIVPISRRDIWRYTKIKDIPGSKSISEGLAWGAVIALLPLFEPIPLKISAAIVSFLFVFSVTYVRSALFSIFQAQGDLIVGVETLPIILGEKKTILLLKWVIFCSALLLLIIPFFSPVGPFSYALLFCFLSLFLCLLTYEKRWLYPGTRFEALVEGNLFLAGLLALCWQIFS